MSPNGADWNSHFLLFLILSDFASITFALIRMDWINKDDYCNVLKCNICSRIGNYTYVFLLYKDVESGLPNSSQKYAFCIKWFLNHFQMLIKKRIMNLFIELIFSPEHRCSETGDEFHVSSLVMSCYLALGDKPVYNLTSPALLYFKTSVSYRISLRYAFNRGI